MKRRCYVKVERFDELYCGEPTGRTVFHTSEVGSRRDRICTVGCPLGRGYTTELSISDFIFRANADDASLRLTRKDLEVTYA